MTCHRCKASSLQNFRWKKAVGPAARAVKPRAFCMVGPDVCVMRVSVWPRPSPAGSLFAGPLSFSCPMDGWLVWTCGHCVPINYRTPPVRRRHCAPPRQRVGLRQLCDHCAPTINCAVVLWTGCVRLHRIACFAALPPGWHGMAWHGMYSS